MGGESSQVKNMNYPKSFYDNGNCSRGSRRMGYLFLLIFQSVIQTFILIYIFINKPIVVVWGVLV